MLLGWEIVSLVKGERLRLKIVETEAYHQNDPASHSFRGVTARTAPMFAAAGTIYVYFTYGAHYCLNFVTGEKGVGEGVLIRAGEPLEGIEAMKLNRRTSDPLNIASGPGKLTQALGIKDTKLSGEILNKSSIFLYPPNEAVQPGVISASPRIGIKKAADNPWRFYIKGSPYVSRLH